MNDFQNNLKEIISNYHISLIDDSFTVYALFSDLHPDNYDERKCLKTILQLHLPDKIKKIRYVEECKLIKDDLKNFNLDRKIVDEVVEAICNLLDIKLIHQTVEKENNPENSDSDIFSNIEDVTNATSISKKDVSDNYHPKQVISKQASSKIKQQSKFKEGFIKGLKKGFLIVATLLVVTFVVVGNIQSSSYIEMAENYRSTEAEELRSSFFEKVPFMNQFLDYKVKKEIKKIVNEYNNEKVTYDVAYSRISLLSYDHVQEMVRTELALLDKLKNSKQSYYDGIEALNNDNVILATQLLSKVIEEDSFYKEAKSKLKDNQDSFKDSILSNIEVAMTEQDYYTAVSYSDIGGSFSTDEELRGMKVAADESGNPYLYQIGNLIINNLKDIEKDKDNKGQDCLAFIIFKLSDTHFLLGSQFGTSDGGAGIANYSIVCYEITTTNLEKIDGEVYSYMISKTSYGEKLLMRWDPKLDKKEKEQRLYEKLYKFGSLYSGDKSEVSVFRNKTDIEDGTSNDVTNKSFMDTWYGMLIIVLLYIVGTIFGIVIFFAALAFAVKSMCDL